MAKKNLINADMLLATPRKSPAPSYEMAQTEETELSTAEERFLMTTHEIIELSGEPVAETPTQAVSSVKRGLKGNETRATFIVDENLLEKLKAIAYWERLNIKDVINDALETYIADFETQKGLIKPVPNKSKA